MEKEYDMFNTDFMETNECCDICGTHVSKVIDIETKEIITTVCTECELIADIFYHINK